MSSRPVDLYPQLAAAPPPGGSGGRGAGAVTPPAARRKPERGTAGARSTSAACPAKGAPRTRRSRVLNSRSVRVGMCVGWYGAAVGGGGGVFFCERVRPCVCVCVCVCALACLLAFVCVSTCVRACVCVCVRVYLYV